MTHFEIYRPLPVGTVRPRGWMLEQMRRDLAEGFAGRIADLSPRLQTDIFGSGKVSSRETLPDGNIVDTPRSWWNGETEAMTFDGLLRLAALADDQHHLARARTWVERLLEFQSPDGYIGIYTPTNRYNHEDENGELWAQGRALAALLAWYELAADAAVLAAVQRCADLTLSKYGPGRTFFLRALQTGGGMSHSLMFVDTMEWLYRLTGEPRYAEFARWLYHDYSQAERLRDRDHQENSLLDPDRPMLGHTPHVAEHMRVPTFLMAATGQWLYRRLTEASFSKVRRHQAPSGGLIGNENVEGRPGSADETVEYCSITEHMLSLHSLVRKTGSPEAADQAEHLLLNAGQAARLADGRAISYLTRDNRFWCLPEPAILGRPTLSPTHEKLAVCCNPNAMRILPYHVAAMWAAFSEAGGEEGLAAIYYGPCVLETTVGGRRVAIEQQTGYPFELTVRLQMTIDGELTMPLSLRIPGWATTATVRVNGTEIQAEGPRCIVRRSWHTGDEVTITFQADIRRHDDPGTGGEFITRGPLMYALPIPARRLVVDTYPGCDLCDEEVIPADAEERTAEERQSWQYRAYLRALPSYRDADLGLPLRMHGNPRWSAETRGDPANPRPWDNSPVILKVEMMDITCQPREVELVPIGTTLLRRATFIPRHRRHN